LLNKGAGTALDILGAIPVLGNWSKGAQAAVNGAQLVGGLVSAGMAVSGGSVLDGGSSGAGLGLTGAASSLPEYTMKFFGRQSGDMIPISLRRQPRAPRFDPEAPEGCEQPRFPPLTPAHVNTQLQRPPRHPLSLQRFPLQAALPMITHILRTIRTVTSAPRKTPGTGS
jgi:hypothetical protein